MQVGCRWEAMEAEVRQVEAGGSRWETGGGR